MNTVRMSITPEAIQNLLDELEASKQSRLRAWNVLQRLRLVLSDLGNVAIPPSAQKTFDAEGEILEHALTKVFPASERGDQRSVLLGTPISGQGRMQIRLSARSSGVAEIRFALETKTAVSRAAKNHCLKPERRADAPFVEIDS
jgi:hypothetical protein